MTSIIDASRRASESVGGLLEGRTDRRRFLGRIALFGATLAAGPINFLVRPQSAWAISDCPQPDGCTSGSCTDGFSAFCCSGTGVNDCPSVEFPRFRGHLSAWPVWAGQEDGVHVQAKGVPRAVSGCVQA